MSGTNPFLSGSDEVTQEIVRLRQQNEALQNELTALRSQANPSMQAQPPASTLPASILPLLRERLRQHRLQFTHTYSHPYTQNGFEQGLQMAEQIIYEEEGRLRRGA